MSRLLLAPFFLIAILLQIQCSYGYDDDATTDSVGSRFVHLNASMMLFFHVEDLRVGNKIPFFFQRSDRAPNFISRAKANSLPPLSLKKLPEICRFFSLPPKSVAAEAMRQTLVLCESPPVQGETNFCATSKESMFDFVRGAFVEFGGGGDFKPLWTTNLTTDEAPLPPGRHPRGGGEEARNYKILSFKEYRVPKAVGCHRSPYPYAVYYCHHFEGGAKVSMTQLESDGGDRVEAPVFCHMETSTWGADHVAFQVLGTKPGVPVCHIFPEYDLVFIPRVSTLSPDLVGCLCVRSRYLSILAAWRDYY